eukprot:COSAG04_NODE_5881_length_1465_cov_1.560029_1_plen_220_part_00
MYRPAPAAPADAGEWKFPGGSVDAGETLEQAAARELAEEFELSLPASALLRPFTVKYTRAIQGRSYTMFNFMAAADENPWLAELDLDEVNARLAAKREHFAGLLESGEFWQLDKEGREAVSPEVRSVQWLDIADAVEVCLTSKNTSLTPVNEWQERAYAEHGITARDPMYATMFTIKDVESAGSEDGLRAAAREFDVAEARAKSAARFAGGKDNGPPKL